MKVQYIEAPSLEQAKYPSIFLAGGITNCPDWQSEVCRELSWQELTLFNPRRKSFPIHDETAAQMQIEWEYERLRGADILLFWFSRGSVNPIVMFEYGSALERHENIVVGVDPGYPRRQDVYIQTALRRPKLKIAFELVALCIRANEMAKQQANQPGKGGRRE